MKFKNTISFLVICIIFLAAFVSAYGVFSKTGSGEYAFKSLHGENISIYGKGLYKNESVSMAAQAKAQDVVTMALGIPLLLAALYFSRKGLLKGRLLLAGTLGYFLYTYTSYSFLAMYNSMFLLYIILMSISFFAFIMTIMTFDIQGLSSAFSKKLPVKFVGGFQIFLGIVVAMMWLGKIMPPLINNLYPAELEHYTTLVIQALDLGFVVPAAILSGVLLIKKRPFGYLFSSVIIIKGITLLTAISAMIVAQINAGVKVGLIEPSIFIIFNLVTIYCMYLIMKNVVEIKMKRY